MSHQHGSHTFWLVSLPLSAPGCGGRRDGAWRVLQERTAPPGGAHPLSSNARLEVPDLRVGTIDALMAQSDELARVCQSVDAVVGKIRRTVAETAAASAAAAGAASSSTLPPPLTIDGQTAEAYLQRFRWDEARYPTRRPLRETVERVAESVSLVEDDLKVRLAELNAVRGALSQALRKATGSLAVRDLGALVEEAELAAAKRQGGGGGGGGGAGGAQQAALNNGGSTIVVDTDNLATAFVVLPRHALKEWQSCYESLASFVVPRSSLVVAEDGDSVLVRCVLFRRCADEFRAAARARGYQARDYAPPPPAPLPGTAEAAAAAAAAEHAKAMTVDALRADADAKRRALDGWCRAAYGEAFSALVHLLVVRLFVESILRYGLPPAFLAAVVRPARKQEARLRAALAAAFGGADAKYWGGGGAGGGGGEEAGGGLGGGVATSEVDAHPYVSLTVSTE
jgi:V-type H+-transporting ATPase subunit C